MFFLLFCLFAVNFHQIFGETEPSWPLFEFWNPLTWLKPRFSSETMYYFLRGGSNKKMYQQLKKSLLPVNLFLGNIIAEHDAWDREFHKKSTNFGEPRRPKGRKSTKNRKQ